MTRRYGRGPRGTRVVDHVPNRPHVRPSRPPEPLVWNLPPYSPDLNPIEKMWSKIKAYLRKAEARTPEALRRAVGEALARVSLPEIVNWFASCGYSLI